MATNASPSPQARIIFEDAFKHFEETVNFDDKREFQLTTLKDVRDAARQIERDLGDRGCLRNMRRLQPFFDGLDRYSTIIDVLCNGTPYLPYIWAPIKLMLKLASDFVSSFDKLIGAYVRIAENLPRFDRLSVTFQGTPDFQQVLAMVYSDILEFHRRAYKFFRRRGWSCFFDSTWAQFDRRFSGILEDLAVHSDLVDKEANSFHISQAAEMRSRAAKEISESERHRSSSQMQAVGVWLDTNLALLHDELDRLAQHCYPGSTDWVIKSSKIKAWLQNGAGQPICWLVGKPGAGKSVICSKLIQDLQHDQQRTTIFYLCSHFSAAPNEAGQILRSLVSQLVQQSPDLVPYILDEYVSRGVPASGSQLRKMIPKLLMGFSCLRIIIDGLDEIDESQQRQVLSDLTDFATHPLGPGSSCKMLIASRDVTLISRFLSQKTVLSLGDDLIAFQVAVQPYVHHELSQLRKSLSDIEVEQTTMDVIEHRLVEKSNGMFLWVRLVIATLEASYTISDLLKATETLPDGIERAYARILEHISSRLHPTQREIAMQILELVCFARRPLKPYEIQSAIGLGRHGMTFHKGTTASETILDLCRPLIERGPRHAVIFAHFTVKEFMLHVTSGPFLTALNAQKNTSLTLMSYLCSSFALVDSRVEEKEKIVDVARGFHGLHLYANEYWVAHLLEYVEINTELDQHVLDPVLERVLDLCDAHDSLTVRTDDSEEGEEMAWSDSQQLDSHPALQKLEANLDIRDFLRKIMDHREKTQEAQLQASGDLPVADPTLDPSMFSKLRFEYTRLVQQILSMSQVGDVSETQLAKFKQTEGKSAFVCRFQGCLRSTDGFSSAAWCEEHELSHVRRVFCSDPACPFKRIPLSSNTALQQHNHTYHAETCGINTSTTFRGKQVKNYLTSALKEVFLCKYAGCTAPPFQTQYLLNSHSNVHSQNRPHYCLVKGCPRSEGGKGFKRKNEMIRHGLVHDSPGYVCPFCPDREHKYPRPDALHRHVRVHHVDKDRDDAQLREVLSQRPEGPSRGRRKGGI
ncbi:hypothetical protein DL98DRAFT_652239 [Cadophora sp. DSE1049]|nr:hypothetical protein DL98DRAFT_652239 [Cadophora sp. DSE1049]